MGAVCAGGIGKKVNHHHQQLNAELESKSVKSSRNQKQQQVLGSSNQPSSVSIDSKTSSSKVAQRNPFIGRAGTAGLEKAIEVLDTLGSGMLNLNSGGGFVSSMAPRGNLISILSFEVANTISKGTKLLQSLSEENIQFLKKEILHSEGVQQLVSTNTEELLRIAAADKRKEFYVFSREVIRFGDLCKDPQWHNLGRYFSKLDSDYSVQTQLREEAEKTMQDLVTLADYTSELYHELHALDRFEQDYKQKLKEVESLHLPLKGDSLQSLQSDLKLQRKIVRSLKKKSLWSRNLEEIVEKLVDIVTSMHQAIWEAFGVGDPGRKLVDEEPIKHPKGLGVAGLALHYANVINQIDNIASRPAYLPSNTRDKLYHGLPIGVKCGLRSRLLTIDANEKLQVSEVKVEMEKTLRWLVPLATNTIKAHQGFGWVGEWANSGNEFGNKTTTQCNLICLQTLHHADKQKTDLYILDLLIWLHQLTSFRRQHQPVRSPSNKMQRIPSRNYTRESERIQFSQEDRSLLDEVNRRSLLDEVNRRRWVPGLSKSQEIPKTINRGIKFKKPLSRSIGSSPSRQRNATQFPTSMVLDVIDGLDS